MRTAATILILLALASTTSAHVQSFSDTKIIPAGPYTVTIAPSLSPIFTNTLLTLNADVSAQDGRFVQRALDLDLIEPDGTNRTLKMQRSVNGGLETPVVLQQKGNHTLVGRVTDENGTYEGRVWLDVYPSIPYRIFPLDEAQDIAPGASTVFAVQVLDRNAMEAPPIDDLAGSIELWNNDHSAMLRQDNVTFEKAGTDGTWRIRHTFPDAGMYHVRFASASGNFTTDDVPLLHTYATPLPESAATNQTPFPTLLTIVALASLALLRRR